MKIKSIDLDYDRVMKEPRRLHKAPKKPNLFFRTLLKLVSAPDLIATSFSFNKIGMEKLVKNEPCLILMNHSSFIDLEIASTIFYPAPINIICTYDGMIGKNTLMREIGCIPTGKFISDPTLLRDMRYALKELSSSVLMFPEAGYSFDGTSTALPDTLGRCLKYLDVPVVIVKTYGAFSRDPLYNDLKKRKVKVSADVEYLLSREEIAAKSTDELNEMIARSFSFDSYRWQRDNNISITESFRADHLNRVLYKCPSCKTEGKMHGEGTKLTCKECGKEYELHELGYMVALDGITEFPHIPDWFNWERESVRDEILRGEYSLEAEVDISVMINTKRIYNVGSGILRHDASGFRLTGCDGRLEYTQKPIASYTLNSDFFWYEIGDVISIGNNAVQYYCFPKNCGDIVTKARLATEELYKIEKAKRRREKEAASS